MSWTEVICGFEHDLCTVDGSELKLEENLGLEGLATTRPSVRDGSQMPLGLNRIELSRFKKRQTRQFLNDRAQNSVRSFTANTRLLTELNNRVQRSRRIQIAMGQRARQTREFVGFKETLAQQWPEGVDFMPSDAVPMLESGEDKSIRWLSKFTFGDSERMSIVKFDPQLGGICSLVSNMQKIWFGSFLSNAKIIAKSDQNGDKIYEFVFTERIPARGVTTDGKNLILKTTICLKLVDPDTAVNNNDTGGDDDDVEGDEEQNDKRIQ